MSFKSWFSGYSWRKGQTKDDIKIQPVEHERVQNKVKTEPQPLEDKDILDGYIHPLQYYHDTPKVMQDDIPPSVVKPKEVKDASFDVQVKVKGVAYDQDAQGMPPLQTSAYPVSQTVQNRQGKLPPVTPAYQKTIFTPPVVHSKDVIVFIIENSNEINKYKDAFLKIVNNIVEKKKTSLFLFLQIGNGKSFLELMDYGDVTTQQVMSKLFEDTPCEVQDFFEIISSKSFTLASALHYVNDTFKSKLCPHFMFKATKCSVTTFNVICIGAGADGQDYADKKLIASCVKDIKALKSLKGLKYFCIKDTDAIKVAALGFPVIGHIVSDFYK